MRARRELGRRWRRVQPAGGGERGAQGGPVGRHAATAAPANAVVGRVEVATCKSFGTGPWNVAG